MREHRFFPLITLLFILLSVWALQFITILGDDPGGPVAFDVDVGPGQTYTSIQSAIDNSPAGSTIVVHAGTYNERVLINKQIVLKQAPGETYYLNAAGGSPGYSGHYAAIDIVSSDAVTIDGGTFKYTGTGYNYAAIKVSYGDYHEIKNTVVHNSSQGIWIHGGHLGSSSVNLGVDGISVHDNTIKDIAYHGIYVQRTWANVYDNTIFGCCNGVTVAHTYQSTFDGYIRDNEVYDCDTGFWFLEDYCPDYSSNEVWDCDVGEWLEEPDHYIGSYFESSFNEFRNCGIGTYYTATSSYQNVALDSNIYSECGTGIFSDTTYPYPKLYMKECEVKNSTDYALDIYNDLTVENLLVDGGGGCRIVKNGHLTITDSILRTNSTTLDISGWGSWAITLGGCTLNETTGNDVVSISVDSHLVMYDTEVITSKGRGVVSSNLRDVTMARCLFDTDGDCVDIGQCDAVSLDRVRADSGIGSGIVIGGSGSFLILDSEVDSNRTGVVADRPGTFSVDGLEVVSEEGRGLELANHSAVSLKGLKVDSDLTAVEVFYADSLEVSGSELTSVNGSGLDADGTAYATVVRTNITSSGGSISLDFSGHVEVENCSLHSSTGDGIHIPSPSDLTIRNSSVECNLTGLNTITEGAVNISDSSFSSENGVSISMSNTDGISFSNVSLRSPYTSLYLARAKNGSLRELHINSTDRGIGLADCTNITVSDTHIDGSGGTGITLSRCLDVTLYSVDIDGDYLEGIIPDWSSVEELDHDIPENNTFGGKPIHYSCGMASTSIGLDGYGEVILACANDVVATVDNCFPGSAYIMESSDVDLSGSNLTRGLSLYYSEGVTGEGVDIRFSPNIDAHLNLLGSSISLYNSTIHRDPGPVNSIRALLGSEVDLYSTDAPQPFTLANDPTTRVTLHHFIGLRTFFSDGVEPLPGSHYRVTTDLKVVHATSLFGGAESTTDADGRAGPWWIPHQTIRDSDLEHHMTALTVNATRDLSWEAYRNIDPSYDHWEDFTSEDIRVPAVPRGLIAEPLSPGDGVNLTWLPNTDDTVLYRVYRYMDEEWSFLNHTSEVVIVDPSIPNGTRLSYMVSAVDEVGLESPRSIVVNITAWDHEPPEPPKNLAVLGYGGTNASLAWNLSGSDDVELYMVYMVESTTRSGYTLSKYIGMTGGDNFEVEGLDPETPYEFGVIAYDEASNPSMLSNVVGINTPDITPPVIYNVTVDSRLFEVAVSWNTDQPTKGTLFIGTDGLSFEEHEVGLLGLEHSVHLEELSPNTTYYLYLYVVEPSGLFCKDDNSGDLYTFRTPENVGFLSVEVLGLDNATLTDADLSLQKGGVVVVLNLDGDLFSGSAPPGTWKLTVNADGYVTKRVDNILLAVQEWTNVTVHLDAVPVNPYENTCNVTVIVEDENGEPVEGAVICVNVTQYFTDAEGRVLLAPAQKGSTITLIISREGFMQLNVDFTVPSDLDEVDKRVTITHTDTDNDGGGFPCWILIIILLVLIIIVVLVFVIMRKRKKEEDGEEQWGSEVEGGSVVVEEGPSVVVEEGPKVEVENGPSVQVEEGSSSEVETGPSVKVEEGSSSEVETGPSVKVEDGPKVEAEVGPSVEVQESHVTSTPAAYTAGAPPPAPAPGTPPVGTLPPPPSVGTVPPSTLGTGAGEELMGLGPAAGEEMDWGADKDERPEDRGNRPARPRRSQGDWDL